MNANSFCRAPIPEQRAASLSVKRRVKCGLLCWLLSDKPLLNMRAVCVWLCAALQAAHWTTHWRT